MSTHFIVALIMALELGVCITLFTVAVARGMREWAFIFAFLSLLCASVVGLELLRGTV